MRHQWVQYSLVVWWGQVGMLVWHNESSLLTQLFVRELNLWPRLQLGQF